MIKVILGVLISVFVIVSTIVVLYWRDSNHDPSTSDFLIFFGLIPVAISMVIVMPFLLKKWIKDSQDKKKMEQEKAQHQELVEEIPPHQIEWVNLNVFSSSTLSALGENQAIWEAMLEHKSPELDSKLLNGYGLPILSYRIAEVDEMLQQDLEQEELHDEYANSSQRQQRIEALIQQQLEQNTETLWAIAAHLKQSALFYEGQLAHEYRMHPAWINPHAEVEDEALSPHGIEQVTRLDLLNIHLILAEDLLHVWDEQATQEKINTFLNALGIIPQKFHVELHYWGKETAYKEWMNLLQQIQKEEDTVSFVMAVDSEIDQETIDEKTWVSEHYLPSEFIGSCCIAKPTVIINELSPQKIIKIALNETKLFNTLEQLKSHTLTQFEQEQPFVVQLDDITDIRVVKRLEKNFAQTPIEQHHYLYMKPSVGQTEHIAKIFGFMLALQAPEDLLAMVYCCDLPQTQSLIQDYSIPEDLEQETV